MPKTFREKPKKKITSPNFGIENMNLNVCFDYKFILKNLNRKVNKKTDKRKPKKKFAHTSNVAKGNSNMIACE